MLLCLFGCNTISDKQQTGTTPRVWTAEERVISVDSLAIPVVLEIDESRLTKVVAGAPIKVPTRLNVRQVQDLDTVSISMAELSSVVIGSVGFSKPNKTEAIVEPFAAGTPATLLAKDAYIKEQNPKNFGNFSKLQGLTHGNIPCIIQDRAGNIWFATYGGGVSKYDGKTFTHFTEKEGLSLNSVLSMMEDANGNIWFGTNGGGATRYDGLNFTHFGSKQGLQGGIVTSVLEDRQGNIWFGTKGEGATRFDGKFFTQFTKKQGLSNNLVECMLEDEEGHIWFGTDGGGACRFDGTRFSYLTTLEGLSHNSVSCIIQDHNGNLWFGTLGGGLNRYDGNTIVRFSTKDGLGNNSISDLVEDRNNHLWIGTNGGGISEFDGTNFTQYTEQEGLVLNSVRCLFEDRSGNLWIGTWGLGVSKLDGKGFSYYTDREGLLYKVICGILEDRNGDIWFGSGGGVSRFDGTNFYHFTTEQGLNENLALCVFEDSHGNIWSGTLSHGASRFDGKTFTYFGTNDGLGSNDIRCFEEDNNGNIWIGTNGGGVSCFDGKTMTTYSTNQGLSDKDIRSMMKDRSGNIWLGTMNGGMMRYDGHEFVRFSMEECQNCNGILAMVQDRSGIIWFGTNGGGLLNYDGKKFMQLTEEQGLSNNVVQSLTEDASGNLWLGTRFGINKLPAVERSRLVHTSARSITKTEHQQNIYFSSYAAEEGFVGVGVNGGKTMFQSSNGTLWIGANDRLAVYHPNDDRTDTIPPNIQLTGLNLFNENIDWVNLQDRPDTTITLSNGVTVGDFRFHGLEKWYGLPSDLSLNYSNNNLTFNFIGITQNKPKRVKYQYFLEGIDKNWSTIDYRTDASYGNLSHGRYVFKVKAMNSNGYWSDPLEYRFVIRPPWWLTWWAYGTYFILSVGSFVLYVRYRERALKKRQKELEQTVEERTAEVVEEKKVVQEQKELVEEKNKQIVDSITYAKRIQDTILPAAKAFRVHLNDSFILYQPKDIVAGDFYWFETVKDDGRVFFAACDCTGHGVPGAMVSVVCYNALNKSLREFGKRTPAEILDKTSELVSEDFNKNMEQHDEIKDGMDASLCSFDPTTGMLTWAGAYNSLLLIREGQELEEIKADKQPIGHSDRRKPYTNHVLQLSKGDCFYLVTDGYADQFGGEFNKKFQKGKLKELLHSVHHLPMEEQLKVLSETFANWQGNYEQLDDVTIIGVRV